MIEGCKLYVGNTINYAAIPGPYTYSPDETIRLVETYTAIVERRSVKRLNDGKQAEDNDPVLTALGFSPYLYDNRYWEHKRTREELWEELNARYRPGDLEYALEWNKIFYDYPLVNPLYHRMPAPKGMYHIELSTGEVIENAFEII
ncbi:hypothetical protein SDC9_205802 [bioreactor metagenome]|uniref:Uncharacterized protein n=1 Tax=bioreactor metagenome TaxID=1076179 RepID=A0A645J3A1_9ZZZZ